MPPRALLALLTVVALLLAACGGSSTEDEQSASDSPDTAADDEPADAAEASAPEAGEAAETEEAAAAEGDGEAFYAGKTITVLVPTAPGGSVDTTARFMASFLGRHLEGSPEIVVENVPGGNQLIGANEYARRDPDGTNLFVNGNSTNVAQLTSNPQAEFSYADYEALLSFPVGIVVMSHDSSNVTTAEDLLAEDANLIYGGLSPAGTDLPQVIGFDILGLDYEGVFGYESNSALRVSIEQAEVTLNADAVPQYLANLADVDVVNPLFTFGQVNSAGEIVSDPLLPDLPTLEETYELLHGEPVPEGEAINAFRTIVATRALSNVLWVHADAPEEARTALADAVSAMLEDPEFQAGIEDQGGSAPLVGDDIQGPLQILLNPDEEAVQYMRDFLLEEFDLELGD